MTARWIYSLSILMSLNLVTANFEASCEALSLSHYFNGQTDTCLSLEAGAACKSLTNGRWMVEQRDEDIDSILAGLRRNISTMGGVMGSKQITISLDAPFSPGHVLQAKATIMQDPTLPGYQMAGVSICITACDGSSSTPLHYEFLFYDNKTRYIDLLNPGVGYGPAINSLGIPVGAGETYDLEIRYETHGYDIYINGIQTHQYPELHPGVYGDTVAFYGKFEDVWSVHTASMTPFTPYIPAYHAYQLPSSFTYGSGESTGAHKFRTMLDPTIMPYQRIQIKICPDTSCTSSETILTDLNMIMVLLWNPGTSDFTPEFWEYIDDNWIAKSYTGPNVLGPGQSFTVEIVAATSDQFDIYLDGVLLYEFSTTLTGVSPNYLVVLDAVTYDQEPIRTKYYGPFSACGRVALNRVNSDWMWQSSYSAVVVWQSTVAWDIRDVDTNPDEQCACYNVKSATLLHVSCTETLPYICEYTKPYKRQTVVKVESNSRGNETIAQMSSVQNHVQCSNRCSHVPKCTAFSQSLREKRCSMHAQLSSNLTVVDADGFDLYDVIG